MSFQETSILILRARAFARFVTTRSRQLSYSYSDRSYFLPFDPDRSIPTVRSRPFYPDRSTRPFDPDRSTPTVRQLIPFTDDFIAPATTAGALQDIRINERDPATR